MDTDELSNETYSAVILEAEKFNHDLTLQFGILASNCKTEKEFLERALELIKEIKGANEFDLEDLFFGNLPNISQLQKCLRQIEVNIAKVKLIPEEKRHYEFS